MGWIVVEFPEPREVFVGGDSQGDNRTAAGEYNAFSVGDGWQTVWLGGPQDFEPPAQTGFVPATSSTIPTFRAPYTSNVRQGIPLARSVSKTSAPPRLAVHADHPTT